VAARLTPPCIFENSSPCNTRLPLPLPCRIGSSNERMLICGSLAFQSVQRWVLVHPEIRRRRSLISAQRLERSDNLGTGRIKETPEP